MVSRENLSAAERSRVYWFLSDFFVQAPTKELVAGWQERQKPVEVQDLLILRKEFTRLFRGVHEGYGPPPPYETLYRPNNFPTETIDTILGYFRSGGFDASEICEEPPDFLTTELRLMSLLAYHEHESSQNGNHEQRHFFNVLQTRFMQNHLMCWVPDYCQMLIQESRVDFYIQLANQMATFLNVVNDGSWNGKIP